MYTSYILAAIRSPAGIAKLKSNEPVQFAANEEFANMPQSRAFDRWPNSPYLGGLCVVSFAVLCSLALQSILQSQTIGTQFLSQGTWRNLVEFLEGETPRSFIADGMTANPSYGRIFAVNLSAGIIFWIGGAWFISQRTGIALSRTLGRWGVCGWLWGVIPILWELARIIAAGFGEGNALSIFLTATAPLWMALAFAGWIATFGVLIQKPVPVLSPETRPNRRAFYGVVIGAAVYVVIFTAMNWQLYRNLLVPHGDSAMYEEHLWNFTHGKGFRSYLEDRLFLGEHLQVVHLFLLPLHWIWPSLMMLDLCESLALASAAFPVYWITARHSGSAKAGMLVAIGYLLYSPMQYLDIAIDLKTFRPSAFGIPAILFGLDQLERGRIKSAIGFWLIALSAQEDFTIILTPLGLWISLFPSAAIQQESSNKRPGNNQLRLLGLGMAIFNVLYLFLALKYIMPWFRNGEKIHYVGYFQQFGSSLEEVVKNILGNPQLLFSELFAVTTPIYAMMLLVPLGFMALFSPSRLLVGLPLFGLLCLNQLSRTPHHHFHAPTIPILFWATAAGAANFLGWRKKGNSIEQQSQKKHAQTLWAAHFVAASAFATGLFTSMGPLGIGFWDPHSSAYWKDRYIVQERAKKFALVIDEIPKTARVFSTDFVHPRFTHYARSYDYSSYPRKTDEELTTPEPGITYYLVIDTQHPYSTIKRPEDIPQYRDHPEDWELLPDKTDGYYIVLKRRN